MIITTLLLPLGHIPGLLDHGPCRWDDGLAIFKSKNGGTGDGGAYMDD
jgi:hypothetical protein